MTDDVYDGLSELHKYFFILRKDYCVDSKKEFLFYFKSAILQIMCKDMWIYNRLREITNDRKYLRNAEK